MVVLIILNATILNLNSSFCIDCKFILASYVLAIKTPAIICGCFYMAGCYKKPARPMSIVCVFSFVICGIITSYL